MKHTRLFLPVLLALLVTPVLAGPLEDSQARSAELHKAMKVQEERIGRLESQLQNQGLLNLLNQVETLKAEVARLRGTLEEQSNLIATADKRTKDLFADLDDRVKELAERQPAAAPEAIRLQVSQALVAAPATPASEAEPETQAYEAAHALVKSGRYKEAVVAMQAFLKQYPAGTLAPNAIYWTGFSHVGMSDFKSAAVSYQRLLKEFPTSPKAPDAMLSLARARIQMNDPDAARASLEQLLEQFPYSRAAGSGKKLLATLK